VFNISPSLSPLSPLSLSLSYVITLLLNKCKNYVTVNNLLLIVQYFVFSIDFSGWIPLRPQKTDPMETQESKPETIVTNLDSHYLTVPVAVETDLEHVLSQKDLSQIQEQVMNSWNKNHFNLNSDSIPQQLKPFLLNKLLPKNSEELIPQNNNNNNNET
jgi:hypothetical protein